MGREIRLIRALADEGYQYGLNGGEPPIPRDRMVTLRVAAEALRPEADGRDRGRRHPGRDAPRRRAGSNPDGVRDYDLLVPASVETLVTERHAAARDATTPAPGLARGVHPRARRRRATRSP